MTRMMALPTAGLVLLVVGAVAAEEAPPPPPPVIPFKDYCKTAKGGCRNVLYFVAVCT